MFLLEINRLILSVIVSIDKPALLIVLYYMPRKSYRSKRRKKKGGDSGTRRYNLPIPDRRLLKKDAGKGAFKTVWQLQNSKRVVINSTKDQMDNRKINNCDQFNEYLFSKSLYEAYPALFPKVYALNDKDSTEEATIINKMSESHPETSNLEKKYIWLKEACELPTIEDIQGDYLEKAIQLLFQFMMYGLCYIDIKPDNVGKRGDTYLVIDTGREDIYFIPEEYRKDYLVGEILICCMTLYHYLKSKDSCTESIYQRIKFVFQHLLTFDSNEQISTNLITDDNLEPKIKKLRKKLYDKYLEGSEWSQILNHQTTHTLPSKYLEEEWLRILNHQTQALPNANQISNCVPNSVLASISVRLLNYVSNTHIKDFFEHSKQGNNPMPRTGNNRITRRSIML